MKKTKKGFTLVELLVVIAILGILMATLVPNVLSAITKSKMSTTAKQGGDIVKAIISETASRSKLLWPCLTEKDGKTSDEDEISGMTFNNSTEYFKELFDVEGLANGNPQPFIDVPLECVWGTEVTPAKAGTLEAQNVAWSVCAGLGGIKATVPALVTRNADVSQFATSGQDNMNDKDEEIGLTEWPTPFGEDGCVVVLSDGSAHSLPSRDCTLEEIYKKQPSFKIPDSITLKYLKPN